LSDKTIYAIVNPHAGNGRTRRRWPRLHGLLQNHFGKMPWEWTRGRGHASTLARSALERGCERILSVGGDGTHQEVANAFLSLSGTAYPHAVLLPLSCGTGSDLRKSLLLPREPEAAVTVLAQDRVAAMDVGWLTYLDIQGHDKQRCFLNITSLGMGGEVDLRVNRSTKALGGFVSFLWGTLATLFTYRSKTVRFRLDDGPWREEKIILMAVANGQYFGGGMWMAPTARLDNGTFDVILVKDMNRLELISQLGRLYRGTHLTHPKVDVYQTRTLVAKSTEDVWLDVDGEPLGTLPAEFRLIPRALKILVGPGFLHASRPASNFETLKNSVLRSRTSLIRVTDTGNKR
jgi:diacylglycerol kinase (ATP)